MTDLANDLNTTITAAVNARIEASVAEALSGGGAISGYVAAVLSREITIRDRDTYRDRKTTWLKETIEAQIQEATQAAVRKALAEQQPELEAAVAKELGRSTKAIAAQLVGKVAESVESTYGVQVSLKYPGRG